MSEEKIEKNNNAAPEAKAPIDADGVEQIKSIEGAIEAILYAAGYPVKYEKIAEVLGLDLRNTKTLINHMAETYNAENSKHGIALLTFDETCQFCTKEQIEQLKVISETFDVFCYGLLTNFKSELLIKQTLPNGKNFKSINDCLLSFIY